MTPEKFGLAYLKFTSVCSSDDTQESRNKDDVYQSTYRNLFLGSLVVKSHICGNIVRIAVQQLVN